jgi:hypothetical protein
MLLLLLLMLFLQAYRVMLGSNTASTASIRPWH